MIFIEHGIFEVKVEGNLLLVDATGPFNEELIKSYQHALERCISHLEDSTWNQVITLHQLSLFTPEAENLLIKTLLNRKSRRLVACGVIVEGTECKTLLKEQLSRCYSNAGVQHQFFRTIDEAKIWFMPKEE
jgi:hypothetical protein